MHRSVALIYHPRGHQMVTQPQPLELRPQPIVPMSISLIEPIPPIHSRFSDALLQINSRRILLIIHN